MRPLDAQTHIYLDADIEIRSQRRLKQSDNSETKADLLERDNNDKNRRESPLKIPQNALYINNSNMQMEEVLNLVKENLELL